MKSLIRTFALANNGLQQEVQPDDVISIANEFHVLEDNWVQITPYGSFPHPGPRNKSGKPVYPKGVIQKIDATTTQAMINEFTSIAGVIGRTIKGERPWYVGHHDVDPIKYPDPKSYGWIKELANRDDGFYARVEWTPAGNALIANKEFKYFSPYWNVADPEPKQFDEDGRLIVAPKKLNSVGFTNQPNIPVMPLSNEVDEVPGTDDAAHLLIHQFVALGVLADADRDEWEKYFNEDFQSATWALANGGTSDGARKGWEKRRAGMAAAAAKMPKSAAAAGAKTIKANRSQAAREKHQAVLDKVKLQGGRFHSAEQRASHQAAQKYMASKSREAGRAKAAKFNALSETDKEAHGAVTVAKQDAREQRLFGAAGAGAATAKAGQPDLLKALAMSSAHRQRMGFTK